MKLVLFAPCIKSSAIGRSTSLVAQALRKSGHLVAVVRSEVASLMQMEQHDFGVELIPWTDSGRVEDLVRSADALVYQIGDNYAYHRGCLEWLHRAPGVVCLHDFFLGNLFHGWAQDHKAESLATLRSWYGDETAKAYFGHSATEKFIEATNVAAPMTEWICSQAYGVITHSSWGIKRILNSCPGPVQLVPLAYDAPASAAVLQNSIRRAGPHEAFRVLTIGHINPNKRAESVIQAIGSSPLLRGNTTYQLVGLIQPERSELLVALASSLKVNLVISGEVDSDTLLHSISQAHVICCLRWPSLEAASASAIEAMLYGKPTIVTDTGFYSELPDACVRKIRVQHEIADVQHALEWLCENESERLALGIRAAEWAAATFSAANYADRLVVAALSTQRAAPMLKATHSLAGMLWQWEASPSLITLSDITEPLRLFDCLQSAPRASIPA